MGVSRAFDEDGEVIDKKMVWDGTAFLISIKVRIDGCVCNACHILIAPLPLSPFYPSGAVAVNVAIHCPPSASSVPSLLILLLMLFILFLVRAPNRSAAPNPMPQIPWLLI